MPSGNAFRYPVLIIPGFMSSGMEIKESDTKSWVGKRVWINLNSLGFQSLHRGSALDINESLRGESSFSEEKHREYERQFKCKSKWLHHMSLSNDMLTERPNVKVRPISGLNGVDYLTPGALTNHLSYVFGPVIRALQEAGYTDNDLQAATYDWRLPPSELEKRDQYFTNTMRQVEEMRKRNNNTPIVLLCHSLGCKTGHYFLNFAKDHPEGGENWIKKHIHAYMPVGAPHLGAPKAVRATIDGDKMGLDAFLNDEEGLILGRSLGSGPWLAPRELPRKAPPVVFIRKEGVLEITVPPIDCSDLLRERKDSPPKLRLAIIFGKDVLTSDFTSAKVSRGKFISYEFPGTFQFPTTADIPTRQSKEGMIQFVLQEPGLKGAKNEAQEEKTLYESPVCCPLRCAVEILLCPFKYVLCLPCTLTGCIVRKSYELTVDAAHLTAAAVGAGTNVARSAPFSMASAITSKRHDAKVKSTLHHVLDEEPSIFKSQRKAHISARLHWLPPMDVVRPVMRQTSPVALLPKGSAYTMSVRHHKKKHVTYDITDGCELLSNEGMGTTLALIGDRYEKDEMGPRTRSAADAPPVDRVVAIFGVNRPTELGAVYRRRCIIVKDDHRVQKLHTLDSSARLVSNKGGLSLKGGILLETEKGAGKSGDGTVPYWSMNHCRSWKDSCNLKVFELQGADHREILADPKFHQIIIDYVTSKT